jgi:DNA (cytosine-5)-methyltransferase 1
MANHPNRGGGTAAANPTKEQICALRETAGLTQTQAGELIHGTLRAWQDYEGGQRRLHPGLWELFQIKVAMRANPMTLQADGAHPAKRLTTG